MFEKKVPDPCGSRVMRQGSEEKFYDFRCLLTLSVHAFAQLETVWRDSYKCEHKFIYDSSLALGQRSDLPKFLLQSVSLCLLDMQAEELGNCFQ